MKKKEEERVFISGSGSSLALASKERSLDICCWLDSFCKSSQHQRALSRQPYWRRHPCIQYESAHDETTIPCPRGIFDSSRSVAATLNLRLPDRHRCGPILQQGEFIYYGYGTLGRLDGGMCNMFILVDAGPSGPSDFSID